MPVGRGRAERSLQGDSLHARQALGQEPVGLGLDPGGDGRPGGPAAGRVVLEAAARRWVVRRREHDPVRQPHRAPAVVPEDRVRHGGGGRVFLCAGDHDLHPIGRQHLERGGKGRHRQRMGVHAEKQRTGDLLLFPVPADRLADGEDVALVERPVERGPAMARGAEAHPLGCHGRVGCLGVVRGHEPRDVHQHRRLRRLSCPRTHGRRAGHAACLPGATCAGSTRFTWLLLSACWAGGEGSARSRTRYARSFTRSFTRNHARA